MFFGPQYFVSYLETIFNTKHHNATKGTKIKDQIVRINTMRYVNHISNEEELRSNEKYLQATTSIK